MKQELKLTLGLPHSVNFIYGRNKFGSTYLKKEGKEYKAKAVKYIEEETSKQNWTRLKPEEYCYIDTIVYMNKKGRDSDNLFKLIQDSITNSIVVWEDDTFALSRTNRVYIDSENPRVELLITPTSTIGIFDTVEEYERFKEICSDCRRFKKTCSIHNGLLENRILDKVQLIDGKWTCSEFKPVVIKAVKPKKVKATK